MDYNLPDALLLEMHDISYHCMVWSPDRVYVVLGKGNTPEESIHSENVLADNVPILKRPTGGEAVVISPRTMLISAVKNGDGHMSSKNYFRVYNQKIIDALTSLGVKGLAHNGISDISLNEKKILGSSMYRNPDQVFYHAVLNVSESSELLERYLKYPSRTPEYRHGRSHRDFVTSLAENGYEFKNDEIQYMIYKVMIL